MTNGHFLLYAILTHFGIQIFVNSFAFFVASHIANNTFALTKLSVNELNAKIKIKDDFFAFYRIELMS